MVRKRLKKTDYREFIIGHTTNSDNTSHKNKCNFLSIHQDSPLYILCTFLSVCLRSELTSDYVFRDLKLAQRAIWETRD